MQVDLMANYWRVWMDDPPPLDQVVVIKRGSNKEESLVVREDLPGWFNVYALYWKYPELNEE